MAIHDWNHDGKNDWQDNFMDYLQCGISGVL